MLTNYTQTGENILSRMGHRITMENSAVQGQMCDLLSRKVKKERLSPLLLEEPCQTKHKNLLSICRSVFPHGVLGQSRLV